MEKGTLPVVGMCQNRERSQFVVPSFWKEGLGVVEKNTVITYFYRSSIVCSATTPHPSSPEEGTTLGVLPQQQDYCLLYSFDFRKLNC